jgi:hypothetical protein
MAIAQPFPVSLIEFANGLTEDFDRHRLAGDAHGLAAIWTVGFLTRVGGRKYDKGIAARTYVSDHSTVKRNYHAATRSPVATWNRPHAESWPMASVPACGRCSL